MPGDRPQVADLAGPAPLQPAATPVDAYSSPIVQKPRPVNAKLMDLAAALQDIQPALGRFNDKSMAMSIEDGRALAAKNKLAFKEAVDKGIISPGQNPWLAKGYKEQLLSLQAQDYDSALRQQWTQQGIGEVSDPAIYHKFVDNFTNGYIDKMDLKNDPTFNQVFVPKVMAAQANLLDQHTQYQQTRIVEKAKDATYRNIQSLIDGHMLYTSNDNLAAVIKQTSDGMVQNGVPGGDVNRLTTDAITDKAIALGDLTVLDLVNKVQTNAGPLGKTQYAVDKVREATQHIFTLQRERDSYEWTNRERNLKLIGEDLQKQAYTRLQQDPDADISDVIAKAAVVDPDKAKTIGEYRDFVKTQGVKVYENPEEVSQLFDRIHSGHGGPGDINAMAAQRKLEPKTIDRAYEMLAQTERHHEVLDNPNITRLVSETGTAIRGGEFIKVDGITATRELDAKNTLRQGILDYAEKNPNASQTDLYLEGVKLQKIILQGVPDTNKIGTTLAPNVQGRINTEVGPKPAKPLFSSVDDLAKAIEEHNNTQGAGRLQHYAEALGVDVPSLIKAQKAALKTKK